MSWQPSEDPILGDPKTCDALELVIVPRTRDLGDGFEVRRARGLALPDGRFRGDEAVGVGSGLRLHRSPS